MGFANEAPYSFATSSGQLTGESPSVFKHVMAKLGVKEVDGVLTEWGALIPGLKAGRFDAIVASMYVTPKRCKQIIFANPTYGIGEAFIVKNGNPDGVNNYADAVAKGKPFAYALALAEGRRRDAATAPLPNVQPDAPVETYAQRAARQRIEQDRALEDPRDLVVVAAQQMDHFDRVAPAFLNRPRSFTRCQHQPNNDDSDC